MKPLTLQDFINDYQRLVVSYDNPTLRTGFVHTLIAGWYQHIWDDCYSWLDKQNKCK